MVGSVPLLRPYLEGICFTIHTDHGALKRIFIFTDSAKRLEQWCLRLFKFDLDVVHCARIKNQAADAVSRLSTSNKDENPLEDDLLLYASDNCNNRTVPVHTVGQDEDCAPIIPNTKPPDDETEFDPPTTVYKIRTQQKKYLLSYRSETSMAAQLQAYIKPGTLDCTHSTHQWRNQNCAISVASATHSDDVALLDTWRTSQPAPGVQHSRQSSLRVLVREEPPQWKVNNFGRGDCVGKILGLPFVLRRKPL